MAVVGERLQNWLIEQINQRQKTFGSGVKTSRTPNQISYLNSRTAFIKLASSIFFEDDADGKKRLQRMGLSDSNVGSKLAKEWVLFNGIGKKGNRAGISGLQSNPAYGVGGTDFGYVPMPGIQDLSIEYLNRGSLKKAELKILAHNKQQFDIIDALYLRLGYTVLLEFGFNKYINNNGSLKSQGNTVIDNDWFGNDKIAPKTSEEISELCRKQRIDSNGNYDYLLGKISNFSWTLEPNGTYNISLTLMSRGDIIETLNVGSPPVKQSLTTQNYINSLQNIKEQFASTYAADIVATSIDEQIDELKGVGINRFHTLCNEVEIKKKNNGVLGSVTVPTNIQGSSNNIQIISKKYYKSYTGPSTPFNYLYKQDNFVGNMGYCVNKSYIKNWDDTLGAWFNDCIFFLNDQKTRWVDIKKGGNGDYIRFGDLLEFISRKMIPITNKREPIINIDFNEKTNICFVMDKSQISYDPRICLIRGREFETADEGTVGVLQTVDIADIFNGLEDFYKSISSGEKQWGQTMNIYISCKFLKEKVFQVNDTNSLNKIYLKTILTTICDEINTALGGINQLEPIIDEETNTIKIIDNTTIPHIDEIYQHLGVSIGKDYTLLLTGFGQDVSTGNSLSNFVKNVSIETKITKEYATMITIGATAGGYTPGEESTAFSMWNKSLIDRYKVNIGDPQTGDPTTIDPSDQLDEYQEIKEKYAKYKTSGWNTIGIKDFNSTVSFLDNALNNATPNDNIIKLNLESITSYYEWLQADSALKTNKPSGRTGFLPVNINIDLDGISGFKIYQSLKLDTRVLPSNYPETLSFVITKINNKLSAGDWTTSLELMPIANSGNSVINNVTLPSSPRIPPATTSSISTSITNVKSSIKQSELDNAVLRLKIKRVLDDGRQTLGVMQVYDTDGVTELFELKTVELPYRGNQNGLSCIPTGKYLLRPYYYPAKYGKCWWIIGSEAGGYAVDELPGNGYIRDECLIHRADDSSWLMGCIGPGTKFSTKTTDLLKKDLFGVSGYVAGNVAGNPRGVFSKSDSLLALDKINNLMWKPGDARTHSVFLEIENATTLLSLGSPTQLSALGIDPTIGT